MNKLVKDIKIGLKLMKYGIQFKSMIVFACVFGVVGIAYMIFGGATQIMLGMMLLTMCSTYLLQPLMSTSITGCVVSSPMNKCVLVTLPVAISGIGAVVGYLIGVAATLVKYYVLDGYMPHNKEVYSTSQIAILFVTVGALALVLQVYTVVVYRYYVAALIAFFVVFFGAYYFIATRSVFAKLAEVSISLQVGAVGGLVIILLGCALAYLTAKLVYRKPIDAWYYKRTIANGLK